MPLRASNVVSPRTKATLTLLALLSVITLDAEPLAWQPHLARALAQANRLDRDFDRVVVDRVLALRVHANGRCIAINAGLAGGCIAIFLVKHGGSSITDGQCGYAGKDVIFCDTAFLRDYLADDGALDAIPLDQKAPSRQAFAIWVLSHEISHALSRDEVSHFDARSVPRTQREAKRSQVVEYAADSFFASVENDYADLPVERMLIALFNAEYVARYHGTPVRGHVLAADPDPATQFPYLLTLTHPHMTMRAASLLSRLRGGTQARTEAIDFIRRTAPGLFPDLLVRATNPKRTHSLHQR
jgi:hypothetical protein